jgi:hypothetical protein
VSKLRDQIEQGVSERGGTLDDYTVLDVDPYRMDTPTSHRNGEWFADLIGDREIHNRGAHYIAIGTIRPDDRKYLNDESNYDDIQVWSRLARWLDKIPFDQITDERNQAPVFQLAEWPDPVPAVEIGEFALEVPEHLMPRAVLDDFYGLQQDRLAIYGEKTSLRPVLEPLSHEYQADLLLPTGNSSDTMIYKLAEVAAEDGRRLLVFYFADADMSGYNMAVEVQRKLQALKTGWFPHLEFEVRAVALTPAQVREYDLPSEPFKKDPKTGQYRDKRAIKWQMVWGVEQTEIDSIATPRPDLLEEVARSANDPHFDVTLARRVREAEAAWTKRAQEVLVQAIGAEEFQRISREAQERAGGVKQAVRELNRVLQVGENVDLPEPPESPDPCPLANRGYGGLPPIVLSDDDWMDATIRLRSYRAYRQVDACPTCGCPRPASRPSFCNKECRDNCRPRPRVIE